MNSPVSAYVPCYNNAATIRRAVESVLAQTYAPAEVLVIDDGSTDASVASLAGLPVRIVRHERNLGRGAARARALDEAQHELVLGCDAGVELAPDFLARAGAWFEDPRVAAVFGRITDPAPRGSVSRWRARHLFKADAIHSTRRGVLLATPGTLLHRARVMSAGGFDAAARAGEDIDLGRRLLAAGWDVVADPTLHIRQTQRDELAKVLERYWRWNAPDGPISRRSKISHATYAFKVMAAADLRAGDPASAAITALCAAYPFFQRDPRGI